MRRYVTWTACIGFSIAAGLGTVPTMPSSTVAATNADSRSIIVQAHSREAAAAAVRAAGGEITHQLGIIGAVAARLTPAQRSAVEGHRDVAESTKTARCG